MSVNQLTDLYEKLQLLRSHGITRDPQKMVDQTEGSWYYQQIDLGYNYRMTDTQAALGASQMQRLDEFVARRHALARRYNKALQDLPLRLPWQHPNAYSAHHLYVIRVDSTKAEKKRRQVFGELRKTGIGVNVHYIPVHTQPYYRQLGFKLGDFPESEHYYEEAISLPIFSSLSEEDQDTVVRALRRILL